MASRLTVFGRNKSLEGIIFAMELYTIYRTATALDLKAEPMICAGIGGAEDSVVYLNILEISMTKGSID